MSLRQRFEVCQTIKVSKRKNNNYQNTMVGIRRKKAPSKLGAQRRYEATTLLREEKQRRLAPRY